MLREKFKNLDLVYDTTNKILCTHAWTSGFQENIKMKLIV